MKIKIFKAGLKDKKWRSIFEPKRLVSRDNEIDLDFQTPAQNGDSDFTVRFYSDSFGDVASAMIRANRLEAIKAFVMAALQDGSNLEEPPEAPLSNG
jgi:hypothetical protein